MNKRLYQILKNELKSQIINGVYQEGDILPSENNLCETHGINRSTVRQALNELENEGYILKKQGKGSIVASTKKTIGLLSFRGFTDVAGKLNQNIRNQFILKPEITSWKDSFFYPLSEEEKRAGYIYMIRLRNLDENPVMLEHTYIPNMNLPRFCEIEFVNGSLFRTLFIKYNIEITNLSQDIRAIKAESDNASFLKIKQGEPILHIFRKYSTNRKEFYIYSSLFCNTTQYAFSNPF